MDVAENTGRDGQQRAFSVEECVCPPGYSGLSCEVFIAMDNFILYIMIIFLNRIGRLLTSFEFFCTVIP